MHVMPGSAARRACVALLAVLAVAPPARAQETTLTLPESKRAYQLLLPAAAAAKKDLPLVVYLHPSGGTMLEKFKKDYWPLLSKRGCAVAVPLSRSEKLWAAGDDVYIRQVIADVRKRNATDPKRVVLLGISGGGQVALLLSDQTPEAFRAVIAVSTNPVVSRRGKAVWFYPDRQVLKTCPFLVVCHITHGASLKFWRQVRAKLGPLGASISILPVLGEPAHYLPPPEPLPDWLTAVLAGKHPPAIEDPQKLAVAKAFAKPAAALATGLKTAKPAKITKRLTKEGKVLKVTVPLQENFERSKREAKTDAMGMAIVQVRTEHKKWPLYVRVDARGGKRPMAEVLADEERSTRLRGMLYQVHHRLQIPAGARTWRVRIGTITFPDKRRGWRTTLFCHAAAPLAADGKKWVEVAVLDETQKPDPRQIAEAFHTVVSDLKAQVK